MPTMLHIHSPITRKLISEFITGHTSKGNNLHVTKTNKRNCIFVIELSFLYHTKINSGKSNLRREVQCLKEARRWLTIQYFVSVAAFFPTVLWIFYLVAHF
jgi:hypothetical protein